MHFLKIAASLLVVVLTAMGLIVGNLTWIGALIIIIAAIFLLRVIVEGSDTNRAATTLLGVFVLLIGLSDWLLGLGTYDYRAVRDIASVLQWANDDPSAFELDTDGLKATKEAHALCVEETPRFLLGKTIDGMGIKYTHWATAPIAWIWQAPPEKTCIKEAKGLAARNNQINGVLEKNPNIKAAFESSN